MAHLPVKAGTTSAIHEIQVRRIGLGATSFDAHCESTLVTTGVDPLPSWNGTGAKQTITSFVERVTHVGTSDFVAERDRIAVFDNDGTLWPEAPVPFQAAYLFDELKRRVPTSLS